MEELYPSLIPQRAMPACDRASVPGHDGPAFCIARGAETNDCDPNEYGFDCEACGEEQLCGFKVVVGIVAGSAP